MSPPGKAEAIRAMGFRALGYGFPLLTIPAFAGAMSAEEYGRLGLALTFCSVLQAIAEGGHGIGGARLLIRMGDQGKKDVARAIFGQKFLLLVICLIAALTYHSLRRSSLAEVVLFIICFCTIVIPDAITPLWAFQASGQISRLARIQFFSRAIALPVMVSAIFLGPTAPVGALLTGLPFVICAWLANKAAGTGAQLFTCRIPKISSLNRIKGDHALVFAGSMAATLSPALLMQAMGGIYGANALGSVYLALVLWLATRQLCSLANQAVFRRFAARSETSLWDSMMPSMVGAAIAALGAALTGIAALVFPGLAEHKYAETVEALPWMLAGLVFYSFGNGVAVNRFAANGRDGLFALVNAASAMALLTCCIVLSPRFDRPLVLGLSALSGDAVLLALALALVALTRR